MSTNFKDFQLDINAFEEAFGPKELVPFTQLLGIELLTRTVSKTPVKTGLAKRNWQVDIDKDTDVVFTLDSAPEDPVAAALATLRILEPFENIHVFNNLVYVPLLEDGYSLQAPNGMLAVSIQEIEALFS